MRGSRVTSSALLSAALFGGALMAGQAWAAPKVDPAATKVPVSTGSARDFDPFNVAVPTAQELASKSLVVQSPVVLIDLGKADGAKGNGSANGLANKPPAPPKPPPPRSQWKPDHHLGWHWFGIGES